MRWTDLPEGYHGFAFAELYGLIGNNSLSDYFAPMTIASSFGDKVYYHGMVPSENGSAVQWTPQEMVDTILNKWMKVQYEKAALLAGRDQGYEIGKIVHTISDIYCQSHVQREPGVGAILRFQDYGMQSRGKHGAADYRNGETEPFYQAAIAASTQLLTFLKAGASWTGPNGAEDWLLNGLPGVNGGIGPLALAAGAKFGGTDPAYARDVGLFSFFSSDWISRGMPVERLPVLNAFISEMAFSIVWSLGF